VSKTENYLIVGIDPGTNFGLAILSLDGKILYVKSTRNYQIKEIVSEILSHGVPVILCTDKVIVPKTIKEIASDLRIPVFHPKRDFSFEEKSSVISNFDKSLKVNSFNEHEVAALFAAIKAFKHFRNEMNNVDSLINNIIRAFDTKIRTSVKLDLIRGIPPKRSLVNHARELLSKELQIFDSNEVNQLFSKQFYSMNKEIVALRKRVKELESIVNKLSSKNKTIVRKVTESVVKFIPEPQIVSSEVEASKVYIKSNMVEVISIERISSKIIRSSLISLIKDKKSEVVVHTNRIEGDPFKISELLKRLGIKIVFVDEYREELSEAFVENGIYLFPSKDVTFHKIGDSFYLDKTKLIELTK